MFDGLIDQAPNYVEALLFKRLFEIPERTGPQGLEGAFRATESRDDNAGQVRADLVNSLDDVQAVHAGHLDVTQDKVDGLVGDKLQSVRTVACRGDSVPLAPQNAFKCPPV